MEGGAPGGEGRGQVGEGSPVAPAKTSPWAGLSDITAVASTVDARSNVSAPEVVICPEGVTVTAEADTRYRWPGQALHMRHSLRGHIPESPQEPSRSEQRDVGCRRTVAASKLRTWGTPGSHRTLPPHPTPPSSDHEPDSQLKSKTKSLNNFIEVRNWSVPPNAGAFPVPQRQRWAGGHGIMRAQASVGICRTGLSHRSSPAVPWKGDCPGPLGVCSLLSHTLCPMLSLLRARALQPGGPSSHGVLSHPGAGAEGALLRLTGGGCCRRKQRDILGGVLLHWGCRQLVLLLAPFVWDEEPDGTTLWRKVQAGWWPHCGQGILASCSHPATLGVVR